MAKVKKTYVATTKFNVGMDDTGTLTVYKGDEVLFDGTTAVIGGDTYNLPRLRSAVQVGWLVEEGAGQNVKYQAPSANIQVRGATPQHKDFVQEGNTTLSDEERVVHSVSRREAFADDVAKTQAKTRTPATTVIEDRKNPRGFELVTETDAESGQEAVPLGTAFKTAARSRVDLTKTTTPSPHQEDAQVIGSAHRRYSEGISFDNYNVSERSAIGTEDPDSPQEEFFGQGESPENTAPLELPELTEEERDADLDIETREGRWALAKIIHPDLPEWDFKMNWRHKIELLKQEYAEQELVLRAVYAAESEAIKKRMKALFDL